MTTDLAPRRALASSRNRDHDEYLVLHRRMVAAAWRVAVAFFETAPDRERLATEAVDEALVRAVARWRGVRRRGNPEAWVAVATMQVCRKLARRQPLPPHDPSGPPRLPDVATALRWLRPRERTVVVLREWARLSEADIALYLGTSEETVTGCMVSAWGKLRVDLGRDPF
jgi:DNA-directed RNA polymerase specialized sigma24 family protein